MIFFLLFMALLVWVIQKLWKSRRILMVSRKIRNKYIALPIVGHGLMFLGTGEDRMAALNKFGFEAMKSKYKITSLWLGSQLYAFTADPVVAALVSKTCLEKPEIRELSKHLLGNGSIFAEVHIWRPRRKVLAPTFSVKNVSGFVDIFAEQSVVMVDCLKPRVGKETFSIWKYITSYTMDSVCQTVLGVSLAAQKLDNHPFLEAFDKYLKIASARLLQPWLHWDRLFELLPAYTEAEKYKKTIHHFVDDIIRKKRISLEQQSLETDSNENYPNSELCKTFLDFLIKSSGGSQGYTDVELREECLVLLIAGTDTSAVGACFAAAVLSRHLDVQEKAYEEIREIFGNSDRPVTLDDLPKLKYIEAVIKETLRLYPPVPVIVRQIDKDVELPTGITLPAGTCVGVNIWGLQRNPRYWGADAEEFNPGRFFEKPSGQLPLFAFSSGPRNCLGNQYAMMSMKVALATLLRNYRVLPPSELSAEDLKKPLRLSFVIMMKDVDNFQVRLEPR